MAFYLSGTLTVPPQDLERLRAALPLHVRLTRAEAGCRLFVVEEGAGGVFTVHETFDSADAFAAHQRIRGTEWEMASAAAIRNYRTWEDEA